MPDTSANSQDPAPEQRRVRAFIVGTSRGGTTWLSRVLNCHPEICSFGETIYWGRGYVAPASQDGYSRQELDRIRDLQLERRWWPHGDGPGALRSVNADGNGGEMPERLAKVIDSLDAPVSPQRLFDVIVDTICECEGKQLGVEKTPHHLNWHERISEGYPEVRFIVLIREPYSFMRSYKNQGRQLSKETSAVFRRAYHPIACSLVWRGYVRSADKLSQNPKVKALRLDSAAMWKDQEGSLGRVQEFLGVSQHPIAGAVGQENSSTNSSELALLELDAADYFWMNLICGRYLRANGIERKRGGFALFAVLKSVINLPAWSIRRFMDMRKITDGSLVMYLWKWVR